MHSLSHSSLFPMISQCLSCLWRPRFWLRALCQLTDSEGALQSWRRPALDVRCLIKYNRQSVLQIQIIPLAYILHEFHDLRVLSITLHPLSYPSPFPSLIVFSPYIFITS
jgi:hypothetical protein